MEKMVWTPEIKEFLKNNVHGVINGFFIKRRKGSSSLQTLERINENKDKLTIDDYAILDHIYQDEQGDIKAFCGKYYEDYGDFKDIYQDSTIDKGKIIDELIKVILELESIGIQFIDIHSRNILVNSNSHIKLCDLDEALLSDYVEYKVNTILDLIIECFLFYDITDEAWNYLEPRHVLKSLESKSVLSSSFVRALNGVESPSSFYSKVDSYIDELKDQEKILIIRREIKRTKPEYF